MSKLKILTLDKWLSYFETPTLTYNQFINKALVYTMNGHVPLMEFQHKNYGKVSNRHLRMLYDKIVTDRFGYLINFYNKNLLVPDKITKMVELPPTINNNQYPQFKILVRNLYFKDILLRTQYLKKRSYLEVIIDLYRDHIIDRGLLAPSVLKMLDDNKLPSLLSGMYFRASIMNPFLVYSLSDLILRYPKRVLTPCLGWSSYILGFMENKNLRQYVGTDVIEGVCQKTRQLAKIFRPDIECDIYCKPSEDLYKDRRFMKRYTGVFDTVFFCPPYYQLELYDGKQQSTERYTSYQEWLDGYWDPTIKLCYHCLKMGGYLCYIISGYINSSKNYLDLDTDMHNVILDNNFRYIDCLPMSKHVKFGKNKSHKQTSFNETIYLFIKN